MTEHQLYELNERVHRLEEQRPIIAELKSKVARLERTLDQVRNLEVSLARAREIEAEHSHEGQVRLPPQIGEIIKNLDQPLEGIRRTFSCARCGTKNRVAVHIKCTACDTNSWLGWWPERRPRANGEHASGSAGTPHVEHARVADHARPLRADL
jgi:hypothetical protein